MKNFLIYPKSHNPEKQTVIFQPVYVLEEFDILDLEKTYNVCDLQGKEVDLKALKEKKKEIDKKNK